MPNLQMNYILRASSTAALYRAAAQKKHIFITWIKKGCSKHKNSWSGFTSRGRLPKIPTAKTASRTPNRPRKFHARTPPLDPLPCRCRRRPILASSGASPHCSSPAYRFPSAAGHPFRRVLPCRRRWGSSRCARSSCRGGDGARPDEGSRRWSSYRAEVRQGEHQPRPRVMSAGVEDGRRRCS